MVCCYLHVSHIDLFRSMFMYPRVLWMPAKGIGLYYIGIW